MILYNSLDTWENVDGFQHTSITRFDQFSLLHCIVGFIMSKQIMRQIEILYLSLSVSPLSPSPGMQIRVGTSPTLTVAVHLLLSPLLHAFDLSPMPTQPMGVNRTQPFHRLAHSSSCWHRHGLAGMHSEFHKRRRWSTQPLHCGVINPKLWVSFLMGAMYVWPMLFNQKRFWYTFFMRKGWRDTITKRDLAYNLNTCEAKHAIFSPVHDHCAVGDGLPFSMAISGQ